MFICGCERRFVCAKKLGLWLGLIQGHVSCFSGESAASFKDISLIFYILNADSGAEIWRFNGFQNGGRPPSWICEIQIF